MNLSHRRQSVMNIGGQNSLPLEGPGPPGSPGLTPLIAALSLCDCVSILCHLCVRRYTASESVSSEDQFTVISLIHISNVQSEDLSTYNCTASNDLGVTSVIITLQDKGLMILSVCLSVCLCVRLDLSQFACVTEACSIN